MDGAKLRNRRGGRIARIIKKKSPLDGIQEYWNQEGQKINIFEKIKAEKNPSASPQARGWLVGGMR